MKKVLALVMGVLFLFSGQLVMAQTSSVAQPVEVKTAPPTVDAQAAILIDAQSGLTLYAHNADERLPIASITKIMTAILALEKGNLDAQVTVGKAVLDRKHVYGTMLYLVPGEKLTLRDLLYALLMNSDNDAAAAIAEYIGGSEQAFVDEMNAKAKELGATDTHFVNPHGLSEPGHYSSAHDMALFARYAMQIPQFAQIVKTKEKQITRSNPNGPHTLHNIDQLLWLYKDADGVKTGYTAQAGPCIVASATRNGRRQIAVILKAKTGRISYKDAANLLDYGFNNYHDKLVISKGQVMDSADLGSGRKLALVAGENFYVTLPQGDDAQFTFKAKPTRLNLPIKAGEQRGQVEVYQNGTLLKTLPLMARDNVAAPGSTPAVTVRKGAGLYIGGGALLFALLVLPRLKNNRRRRVVKRKVAGMP
ncbi:MAG TPA: D-alanyl-D-alanine carboxypeptidase family protein [Desulfobacteria bacterium]|nr:D-alanyl-D-alanine carboxypeptidase family protein [Desulfobacteria bacterium]